MSCDCYSSAVPLVGLQCMMVVFSDHIHSLLGQNFFIS